MALTPQRDDSSPAKEVTGSGDGDGNGKGRRQLITVIRYGAMNWVGEFTCKPGTVSNRDAPVVVQTDRGIELGEQMGLCGEGGGCTVRQVQLREYVKSSGPEFCRLNAGRVLREATAQDLDEHRRLNAHAREDIEQCARLAGELNLDMKVITAEHLLGGERIVFYFRSDERVDFRELVKQLAQGYRTRIEMRQVGARDEARLVADWEVCGRECCCKSFLKKLRPVNMKMAKLQKSTLDPSKVSGRCGRLRCCLRYEHEGYVELLEKLPRRGTRVRTPSGEGTVEDYQIMTQLVLVRSDSDQQYVVPLEEISEFDLPKPKPAPPAEQKPPQGAARIEQAPEPEAEGTGTKLRRRRRRRREKPAGTPSNGDGAGAASGEAVEEAGGGVKAEGERPAEDKGAGGEAPGAGKHRRGRRRRRRKPSSGAPPKAEES